MIRRTLKFASRVVEAGIKAYSTMVGSGQYLDATDVSSGNRSPITPISRDSKDTFRPWDRLTVLGIARSIKENVGFAKGAVGDVRRFSIGEGIKAISACEDSSVRPAYDDYFDTWSEIGEVTQRHDMRTLDGLMSEAMDVDGDFGIVLTETPTKYAQIQVIESHCIGDRRIFSGEDGFYDGVKLNLVGRPVAYKVRRQIEEEDVFEVVSARDFIHVFDASRFDSIRGLSAFTHGINHIRDKRDTLSLIKMGIKLDAAMGVAIIGSGSNKSPFRPQKEATAATDTTPAQPTIDDIRAGAIFNLPNGADVKTIMSDRPSPNVPTFLSYIDRDVAVGLGVPIEFIWDPSSLGGAGNRFILKKAEKKFFERQMTLTRVKRRIRNYVIAKGINRGDLPYVQDWWKVRFQFPSRITVDVGREADANREDFFAGLRTAQEDYGERGVDFYEARQQISEAAEDLLQRATVLFNRYKEHGLTLEMAIQLIEKRGNSGSPPANNQQSMAKKESGGAK